MSKAWQSVTDAEWMEYCSLIAAMINGEAGADLAASDWLKERLGKGDEEVYYLLRQWMNHRWMFRDLGEVTASHVWPYCMRHDGQKPVVLDVSDL